MRHLHRGNVLPLALVIMTTILLGGLGVGIIVMQGLRRTSEIDASMNAYYAADAGVERQLYELRKRSSSVGDLEDLSATFVNGSEWSAASSTYLQTLSKTFTSIAEDDFAFVDLYDPDNIGAAAGVRRVDWNWGAGSDCPGGIPPEVEMGYARWLSGGSVLPQDFTVTRGLTPGGMTTLLETDKGYRLRFRPKGCSLTSLEIEVSPDVGYAPMQFPGDITIGAVGEYRRATQAITVTVPRQDVLSGVFSFAVFSECQLIKDPENPNICS